MKSKFNGPAEVAEGILKLPVPAMLLFPLVRESIPVAVKLFILPLVVNIVVVVGVALLLDIDIVDIAEPGLGLGLGGPPNSSSESVLVPSELA